MQAQLWTLNALATELGRDRRSLARLLEDLAPDEQHPLNAHGVKPQSDAFEDEPAISAETRMMRLWKLSRVIGHLYDGKTDESALDLNQERARLAAAQAEKTETENRVRAGELIEATRIERVWIEHIANARSKFLSMSSKLAPRLVGINDSAQIAALIKREVHAALNELADNA